MRVSVTAKNTKNTKNTKTTIAAPMAAKPLKPEEAYEEFLRQMKAVNPKAYRFILNACGKMQGGKFAAPLEGVGGSMYVLKGAGGVYYYVFSVHAMLHPNHEDSAWLVFAEEPSVEKLVAKIAKKLPAAMRRSRASIEKYLSRSVKQVNRVSAILKLTNSL